MMEHLIYTLNFNIKKKKASFLIEINAEYSWKAGDKNCQSPNLGCIIDGEPSYMNSHNVMSH
jgi:hypothetical protein